MVLPLLVLDGITRRAAVVNFYHRFIPKAAEIQKTLYDLAAQIKKRDGPLQWTDDSRATFDTCRKALAATAHLAHPKPNAELRINTDASSTAIGAVIEQKENGEASWLLFQETHRRRNPV